MVDVEVTIVVDERVEVGTTVAVLDAKVEVDANVDVTAVVDDVVHGSVVAAVVEASVEAAVVDDMAGEVDVLVVDATVRPSSDTIPWQTRRVQDRNATIPAVWRRPCKWSGAASAR